MFIDLRQVQGEERFDHDLCVVGAGAAGLALAMEFVGTPYKVAVIESGGFDFDSDVQDLYQGQSKGLPYADLDVSRLRYFGGTTNHWAGYCSPLAASSFAEAPWIPHSGWPITLADLQPFYRRARDLLGMENKGWSPPGGWSADVVAEDFGDPPMLLGDEVTTHRTYVINPVRMAERFRSALDQATNISVFLHANLFEIMVTQSAETVSALDVRTLDGKKFSFRARQYVLATGGIENARLLLSSTSTQSEGLGNANDLVGRFFSDHLDVSAGEIVPADPTVNLNLYNRRPYGQESEAVIFQDLTFDVQRQEELTSGALQMRPLSGARDGYRAARRLAGSVIRGEDLDDIGRHIGNVLASAGEVTEAAAEYLWHGGPTIDRIAIKFHIDAAPNPESRVMLGNDTDALGMRRVVLDWQLSEIDIRTIQWMSNWIGAQAAQSGLGRFKSTVDQSDVEASVSWHWHNISTTRMADDPKHGVVDADCRVHGIDNLFIAGSSVFSTCGAGSPTFTIVTLAIRLADRLKQGLKA